MSPQDLRALPEAQRAARTPRGQLGGLTDHSYDPLVHLGTERLFSGVTLRFAPLANEQWGTTQWLKLSSGEGHRALITLLPGLSTAEIRSTLTHELVHVERGPAGPACVALDEAVVDLVAASRLIPVAALAGLRDSVKEHGEQEVANALQVDLDTVKAGLRLLAAAGG